MIQPNLSKLEKKLKIKFKDQKLLLNVFVHRSYLNEHPDFALSSNERLEFLGDACLELVVSKHLFLTYLQSPEGDLTNYRSAIVNTHSLAETAKSFDLGDYLLLSRGENESGGRENEYLLANTYEALLGAIYLEKGFKAAEKFVQESLLTKLPRIVEEKLYRDPKSRLQELTQEVTGITPIYKVSAEWGPDHNKTFRVAVFIGPKKLGEGEGQSKQKAELTAAQEALDNWEPSKYNTIGSAQGEGGL